MPTDRPCATCGMPTRSITQLCPEHRPQSNPKRPERPCSGCGTRTVAKNGVCRRCTDPERASKEARPCIECRVTLTDDDDGVCGGCEAAMKDDESPYDLDANGDWRFNPFTRVEVWVPRPVVPERRPEPKPKPKQKRGPRVPDATRDEAERFSCDYCGAKPGKACMRADGTTYRPRTHMDRRFAAEAARLQGAVA